MTDRQELSALLGEAFEIAAGRRFTDGSTIAELMADHVLTSEWFRNLTVGRVSQKPLR